MPQVTEYAPILSSSKCYMGCTFFFLKVEKSSCSEEAKLHLLLTCKPSFDSWAAALLLVHRWNELSALQKRIGAGERCLWARTRPHTCWGISGGLWGKGQPSTRAEKGEEWRGHTVQALVFHALLPERAEDILYVLAKLSTGRKAGVKQVLKAAGGPHTLPVVEI